ncbi:hypothetical protein U1Q18_041700 [Sarracenia purpurea var. burkii]
MKRFKKEISTLPPPHPAMTVVDLISDFGESQSELEYLLEASDDELGVTQWKDWSQSGLRSGGSRRRRRGFCDSVKKGSSQGEINSPGAGVNHCI